MSNLLFKANMLLFKAQMLKPMLTGNNGGNGNGNGGDSGTAVDEITGAMSSGDGGAFTGAKEKIVGLGTGAYGIIITFTIVGAVLMGGVAGLMLIFGDAQTRSEAKKKGLWICIGIAIALGASAIVAVIAHGVLNL